MTLPNKVIALVKTCPFSLVLTVLQKLFWKELEWSCLYKICIWSFKFFRLLVRMLLRSTSKNLKRWMLSLNNREWQRHLLKKKKSKEKDLPMQAEGKVLKMILHCIWGLIKMIARIRYKNKISHTILNSYLKKWKKTTTNIQ